MTRAVKTQRSELPVEREHLKLDLPVSTTWASSVTMVWVIVDINLDREDVQLCTPITKRFLPKRTNIGDLRHVARNKKRLRYDRETFTWVELVKHVQGKRAANAEKKRRAKARTYDLSRERILEIANSKGTFGVTAHYRWNKTRGVAYQLAREGLLRRIGARTEHGYGDQFRITKRGREAANKLRETKTA